MDEGNFKFKLILVEFKNTKYKEKILKTSREKSELVKSPLVFFFFFNIFIGVWLLYNGVLVSAL